MLSKIQSQLGKMRNEAPKVLKKAVNETAKQARKDLSDKAQKTYVVKSSRFNKAMKIKNATIRKPEALIRATGQVMGLKEFRVRPATIPKNENRPEVVKAKVLKSGKMKSLQMGNLKAFVTKFENGHLAVVQRKGKKRYPIKTLSANSIPIMIRNEKRVYGVVEPNIKKNLKENVEKQIKIALGRE